MAVPVEGFSVIIRNSTIERNYPGGLKGYAEDFPFITYCADPHINCIAFMDQRDASEHVDRLKKKGLPSKDGKTNDIAAIVFHQGPIEECDWLAFAQYKGVLVAWLASEEPGDLYAPADWSFEAAIDRAKSMQYMTVDEVKERLDFVRTQFLPEGGYVDVYRDKQTGEELFIGRTQTPEEVEHNRLFQKAVELSQNLIFIAERPDRKLSSIDEKNLNEAIGLFKQAIEINNENWSAMWLLGKIHQRLNNYTESLQWFSKAHSLNPQQPDVAREAAIAAMESGRPQEAIAYCQRAIEAEPEDAGLKANLALALLFSERIQEAQVAIKEALNRAPKDKISAHLNSIINEVATGKRACPHHTRDLD